MIHLCEMSRTGKSTQRESKLVARGYERVWEVTANWYGVSFWGDENTLELDRVMVAQHRECTKCH